MSVVAQVFLIFAQIFINLVFAFTWLIRPTNNDGIYTLIDGGSTWTKTTAQNKKWRSIASSSDGSKLAAVATLDGIYTSTDGGMNWAKHSEPSQKWSSIASSSDGSKLAAVALQGGIWVSP
jgi:photosystem II stability/assembly factor-like uncharacterized protein